MKVVSIASFKGGTAKTSTILHLGANLALFHGQRVLLVDFDAQANLTSGLGFDCDSIDSMAAVLQGQKEIGQVIQGTKVPGLDLIAADTWLERIELTSPLAADRYSHERLKHLICSLDYDWILIDTPPSLSWLTESALIAAHFVIVSATAEFYSVKGLERLSLFLKTIDQRHPLQLLGVLLSFWNPRGKNNTAFLQVIEQNFPAKIFKTRIRKDSAVAEAAIRGQPVFTSFPKCRASDDFAQLAREVLDQLKET